LAANPRQPRASQFIYWPAPSGRFAAHRVSSPHHPTVDLHATPL
jgi:hypothetical protein